MCVCEVCVCDVCVCTLVIRNTLCTVCSTLWNKHHLATLVGQHHLRVEGRWEGGGREVEGGWEGRGRGVGGRGNGREKEEGGIGLQIKYAEMMC